jgi:hypothetical protein
METWVNAHATRGISKYASRAKNDATRSAQNDHAEETETRPEGSGRFFVRSDASKVGQVNNPFGIQRRKLCAPT